MTYFNYINPCYYAEVIYYYLDSNTQAEQTTNRTQAVAQPKIESQPTLQSTHTISSWFWSTSSVTKDRDPPKEKGLFPFKVHPSQTALKSRDLDDALTLLQRIPQKEFFDLTAKPSPEEEPFEQLRDNWHHLQWDNLYDKDNLSMCMLAIGYIATCTPKGHKVYQRIPDVIKHQGLSECDCTEANLRTRVESAILSIIERNFKNHKQTLTYVSIGSGGCFQDWVILCELILLDYTKVEIHLCDKYINTSARRTMEEFFTHFPNIAFTIHCHPSLRAFTEINKPADVVLAIDFNGDFDQDLPTPKLLLSQNGFAYCALKSKDLNLAAIL